jgi:hypothetical protein
MKGKGKFYEGDADLHVYATDLEIHGHLKNSDNEIMYSRLPKAPVITN